MAGIYFLLFTQVFFFVANFPSQCFGKNERYYKNSYADSNPDTYLTTPKIIRRHGYPAEAHIIQSEDGYLLEYHRIPHTKNKTASTFPYPVLLHHGLLTSSSDWIMNGPGKGLAYRLSDAGYDVWLANARGNTYSRSHISLSPSDKRFWDFTFHEVGIYDVPAAIDYILNITNTQKLIYIGHSLGTTTFFAFASNRPEYSNKILTQISLAPAGAVPHSTSMMRLFAPITKEIEMITGWYYKGAFLEHDKLTSLICKYICGTNILNTNVCEQLIIFSFVGKDEEQFNTTLLPIITSNIPAGTSGKNMIHCLQLISSEGKFQFFDYGTAENIRRYKSEIPPSYNVSSISIPMKFFYGKNDILTDPTDVEILYQQVSKPMGLTMINYDKWNHIDFLLATDVNNYFNDVLLDFVINVTTQSDFVMQSIENALIERSRNPVQHAPFNETEFKNRVAQIPGLVNAVNEITNSLKTNMENILTNVENGLTSMENSFNTTKGDVEKKVGEAERAVSDSIQKTAKNINDGIHETTDEVHNAIQKGVSIAEKSVNASVQQTEQKMKDAIEKLGITLTNA